MKFLRALKILLMVVVAATVLSFIVMHLWNWLMPAIFGLRSITFAQAFGLLLLSKILLGGFHKHGGRGGWRGREWKRKMEQRWGNMTPEERERFKSGMRARWDCRPRHSDARAAEQETFAERTSVKG